MAKDEQEVFLDDDEDEGSSPKAEKVEQQQDPEKDVWLMKTACRVLSKKLTAETESLDALGQGKASSALRGNIGELDERMPRILEESGIEGLSEKQRELARVALPILKKNTKAAKGTNRGIGRDDWSAQCQLIVEYIEDILAPQLEEQTALAGTR